MEDESMKFLSKIFDLLKDGNVFVTQSEEPKAIVDFHHPDEISVSLYEVSQ